ncbi:MAG TPA: DUF2141 domain-containing protein [Saprospiraceae bacterium]|nr:DUF2141 domain-containing protein [Saprospiraceae bacterium]HMQ85497.1 DUF2141 domain-containing protein [Saprospiraceae bacterium]
MSSILFLLSLFSAVNNLFVAPPLTFELRMENLEQASGAIWVAFYDQPDTFLKDEGIVNQVVQRVSATPVQTIEIDGVTPGIYAIAVFHDLNDNKVLDKNALGVPTEPYAFSRDCRQKLRAPRFEEARFTLNQENTKMTFTLRRWKDM